MRQQQQNNDEHDTLIIHLHIHKINNKHYYFIHLMSHIRAKASLICQDWKIMQITLATNKHTLQSQSRRRRRRFILCYESSNMSLVRIIFVLSWDINNDNTIMTIDNTE